MKLQTAKRVYKNYIIRIVKYQRISNHYSNLWRIYTLNKKEWICSLFKEWILEKSEIRVNLEWTFVLFTHFGVTTGITQGFRVIPDVTPKWVNNTNVHSKFTLISLFSKIHSLKSEHIHSFLFREYCIQTYCVREIKRYMTENVRNRLKIKQDELMMLLNMDKQYKQKVNDILISLIFHLF